jgi:hypothetical protein
MWAFTEALNIWQVAKVNAVLGLVSDFYFFTFLMMLITMHWLQNNFTVKYL